MAEASGFINLWETDLGRCMSCFSWNINREYDSYYKCLSCGEDHIEVLKCSLGRVCQDVKCTGQHSTVH